MYSTTFDRFTSNEIYQEVSFGTQDKTQQGLASSPNELLNRVMRGLITPDDIRSHLANHDNDEDTYPSDNPSDLALSYEEMLKNKSALSERIREIRVEKAEKAAKKAADEKKILDEHRMLNQAKELEKHLKKLNNSTSEINNVSQD